MRAILATLCMVVAFACGGGSGGGGSGVSSGKQIIALSDGETADVCEFLASITTARTVECPGGGTITINADPAECVLDIEALQVNAPGCTVTVGQYEACVRAIDDASDAELCGSELPAACAPLFAESCNPG